jgi:hypothetical protein
MTHPVPLTVDAFKDALPDKVKTSVNQSLIDQINNTLSDPELYENYRDNLLSYGKVMAEGRFKITSYVYAVKYVGYKLMGKTNTDSYALTFPDKITKFLARGTSDKDISSYITAYNKSKLVNLLMEQTLVPFWVLNQDLYQKALNIQAELMVTANSEKVRTDAANSLLANLKPPETKKVELDVSVSEHSSIAQLRDATLALAAAQRDALRAGAVDAEYVAKSPVVIEGIT